MAINDTDKLLVNDGSKTETITIAQFRDRDVLNDSDKFLINDGLGPKRLRGPRFQMS